MAACAEAPKCTPAEPTAGIDLPNCCHLLKPGSVLKPHFLSPNLFLVASLLLGYLATPLSAARWQAGDFGLLSQPTFRRVAMLPGPRNSPLPVQQDLATRSPLDPPLDAKRLTTNLKSFGVPFKINANQQAFIEVQLYQSRDQGKTWSFHSRQTTDQEEFRFEADADGEYWFALKTLNRDRQLLPSGDPQPQLKIVVDSVKPELDFRVQTDNAGRVVCRWRASDSSLMPRSLKIFYQPITATGSLKPWLKVPVQLAGQVRNGVYSDQIGFWPETDEATVNVAVEIQDAAGNATRVDRRVNLPPTAWRSRNQATARPQPYATRRPTFGDGGASAVNQPDWAQPGWQPSSNRQNNYGQTAQTKPHSPSAEERHPEKPANVVCENGICQIIGDGNGTFDTVSKRFTPNVDASQSFDPARQQTARQTQPVRSAQVGQLPLNFVGSPEEYADPPIPPELLQPTQVAQRQLPIEQPGSVTWESEGQSWLPHQQTVSATTRRIDPGITPTRSTPAPSSPTTFVPSNPPTTRVEGDQVISESTTRSPRNQYRGGVATAGNLPAPELLPQARATESGRRDRTNPRAETQLPTTGNSAFQEKDHGTLQRLPNEVSGSSDGGTVFSGAGFLRPSGQPKQPASVVEPNSDQPLRETRAPIRMISSKRFRLNYGIDSIDPSGVGRVVLWVTRDDGNTWNQWGTDPDNQSPFPVEVEEQGRFGFRIVVHSKDGLTGRGASQRRRCRHLDPRRHASTADKNYGGALRTRRRDWQVGDQLFGRR